MKLIVDPKLKKILIYVHMKSSCRPPKVHETLTFQLCSLSGNRGIGIVFKTG